VKLGEASQKVRDAWMLSDWVRSTEDTKGSHTYHIVRDLVAPVRWLSELHRRPYRAS